MRRGGRIIPAYAGSTDYIKNAPDGLEDHPRIRGEHQVDGDQVTGVGGSSPHTRGAPLDVQAGLTRGGIIPAYAGSTERVSIRETLSPDHPRIRGEHASSKQSNPARSGSSPHTRGALSAPSTSTACWRIIPAYAGSTFLAVSSSPSVKGSSPHTRGAPS